MAEQDINKLKQMAEDTYVEIMLDAEGKDDDRYFVRKFNTLIEIVRATQNPKVDCGPLLLKHNTLIEKLNTCSKCRRICVDGRICKCCDKTEYVIFADEYYVVFASEETITLKDSWSSRPVEYHVMYKLLKIGNGNIYLVVANSENTKDQYIIRRDDTKATSVSKDRLNLLHSYLGKAGVTIE